jgi:hypothetical protein
MDAHQIYFLGKIAMVRDSAFKMNMDCEVPLGCKRIKIWQKLNFLSPLSSEYPTLKKNRQNYCKNNIYSVINLRFYPKFKWMLWYSIKKIICRFDDFWKLQLSEVFDFYRNCYFRRTVRRIKGFKYRILEIKEYS